MATSQAPTATVELDRPRVMVLSFAELELAEQLTGLNLATTDLDELGVRDMVTLVFACLSQDDPELERAQVARMLHPGNWQEVRRAIRRLWLAAYPEAVAQAEAAEAEAAEAARQGPLPEAGEAQ